MPHCYHQHISKGATFTLKANIQRFHFESHFLKFKYCSATSSRVFADKSVFAMQTTGGCGNDC